jgi:hypothetical protein
LKFLKYIKFFTKLTNLKIIFNIRIVNMDMEQTENKITQSTDDVKESLSETLNQDSLKFKTTGKYKNKKIEDYKEYYKQKYIEKKEEKLQKAKECGNRYREAYRFLIKILDENLTDINVIHSEAKKLVCV